jgi:chloramphenicol-sensitive protein RarD
VAYLFYVDRIGSGGFLHAGTTQTVLMLGAGPVTTLPLLLFAAAVRRISLSSIGMLQFLNPTLQFLIGVLIYREPFSRAQAIGFAMVWAALVIFALEGYVTRRWRPVEELP